MELLDGESLADIASRAARCRRREVVTIARQLAAALGAAHERGVIHADVTPSNVLVAAGPPSIHVKLVDFGLAELAGEGVRDEMPEFVLGTPAYISPEQLRGLRADRSLRSVRPRRRAVRAADRPSAVPERGPAHAVHDARHGADPAGREPARPVAAQARRARHHLPAEDTASSGSPACARCHSPSTRSSASPIAAAGAAGSSG